MGRGGSFGICPGLKGEDVANVHAEEIDRIVQKLLGGTLKQVSSAYRGVTTTGTIDPDTGEITIKVKGLRA